MRRRVGDYGIESEVHRAAVDLVKGLGLGLVNAVRQDLPSFGWLLYQ